jgi:uncharacterized protein YceH (UPF0502 family)
VTPLDPRQARVIGSLIEKQLTTPQQYPLTANALVLACNQSSNRDPVVAYTETEVVSTLDSLKERRLVRLVLPSHGRSVVRYRHVLDEVMALDAPQLALVAVLLLRGPQTVGELRARSERMAAFDSLDAVEHELGLLSSHEPPLVARQPRRPGQKEDRWTELLQEPSAAAGSGEVAATGGWVGSGEAMEAGEVAGAGEGTPAAPAPHGAPRALHDEVAALRDEIVGLRGEVGTLRAALDELRASLGG